MENPGKQAKTAARGRDGANRKEGGRGRKVGAAGFEPALSRSTVWRPTELDEAPLSPVCPGASGRMPAFAATWGRFLVFARRGSPEIRAPGRRRMAKTPADLLYSKSHEWVKLAGNEATIGITDHAQEALNDIVYVELPKVGQSFAQEEEFGVVESVKSVSDLYMPIAGEVTALNSALEDPPPHVRAQWSAAVEAKDPDAIAALYHPDCQVLGFAVRLRGSAALRDELAAPLLLLGQVKVRQGTRLAQGPDSILVEL